MATMLTKAVKRELEIEGKPHMITISPDGLKVTEKGKRKGLELQWKDLISGQSALAVALNASVDRTEPAAD